MPDMANTVILDVGEDRLVGTVPAVWHGGRYLLYSPFSREILTSDARGLDELTNQLDIPQSFWGEAQARTPLGKTHHLSLVLTTDCNLRCTYCFANGGDSVHRMPLSLATDALDQLFSDTRSPLEVTFFGGEPTLEFATITGVVEHCYDRFARPSFDITSNGVFSATVSDFLLAHSFTVTISLDGPSSVQNLQRPTSKKGPSARTVFSNVRRLATAPEQLKLRVTVTKLNVAQMGETVRLAAELGARYIHFAAVSLTGRGANDNTLRPSVQAYVSGFREAVDAAIEYGIEVTDEALVYLLNPASNFCSAALGGKYIVNPDGSLSSCLEVQACDSPFESFIVGNYDRRTERFVFNESRRTQLAMLTVQNMHPCSACPWKFICGGGCPIRNLGDTGTAMQPSPYYCEIKKHLLHEAVVRMYHESSKKNADKTEASNSPN